MNNLSIVNRIIRKRWRRSLVLLSNSRFDFSRARSSDRSPPTLAAARWRVRGATEGWRVSPETCERECDGDRCSRSLFLRACRALPFRRVSNVSRWRNCVAVKCTRDERLRRVFFVVTRVLSRFRCAPVSSSCVDVQTFRGHAQRLRKRNLWQRVAPIFAGRVVQTCKFLYFYVLFDKYVVWSVRTWHAWSLTNV